MPNSRINKIKELVNKLKKDNGWTDLAKLGKALNEIGLNYKALGYLKLKNLFDEDDITEYFELKTEKVNGLNVYYVKVNEKTEAISTVTTKKKTTGKVDPTNLMEWAYMGDFKKVILDLKNMALKERWYYKRQDPANPYPILTNYLKYTFIRLLKEGNKILTCDQYASFNTGLVNELYEPIYALFVKNDRQASPKWQFKNFCIAGQGRDGKILSSNFKHLPERAHYFNNPSDLIYDSKAEPPQLDWEHIILKNVERLPTDFIQENKPADFLLQDTSRMEQAAKIEYYSALAQAIKCDKRTYRAIKNRFEESLNLALKRVEWNFRTSIPIYYPTRNSISLLLPLSLMNESQIDLALVVEKTQSGNYLGHTILPLDWAYSNARLIARLDSNWLIVDKIDEDDATGED